MSNASNNMTHKLNDNNEIAEGLRNHIVDEAATKDSFNTTRIVNTAFAIVGGLVGVGLTYLQSNSNKTSIGIAAGWAAGNALGVYLDDDIHKNTQNNVTSGVVTGLTTAITTGVVGSMSNYLLGRYGAEEKEVVVPGSANDAPVSPIIHEDFGFNSDDSSNTALANGILERLKRESTTIITTTTIIIGDDGAEETEETEDESNYWLY